LIRIRVNKISILPDLPSKGRHKFKIGIMMAVKQGQTEVCPCFLGGLKVCGSFDLIIVSAIFPSPRTSLYRSTPNSRYLYNTQETKSLRAPYSTDSETSLSEARVIAG